MEATKLLSIHLQTTVMSTQPRLENPRHTGYFTDDVGDGEAGWDYNNRHHTEFEQGRKLNPLKRYRNKNYDWNMDNVDSIALLRQEPAEPAVPVEEAAEECDRGQNHADCKDGVPERIYSRLPGSVSHKTRLFGNL